MFNTPLSFVLLILNDIKITQVLTSAHTFAVIIQQNATKVVQNWVSILIYLNKQNADTFLFKTNKYILIIKQYLSHTKYNINYIKPYYFTVFNQINYTRLGNIREFNIQLLTHRLVL